MNSAKEDAQDVYLILNGEQRGPYSWGQVKDMWFSGLANQDTLFFVEGMHDWGKLGDVRHRFEPTRRETSDQSRSLNWRSDRPMENNKPFLILLPFLLLTALTAAFWDSLSDLTGTLFSGLIGIVFLGIVALVYFVPAVIAYKMSHRNTLAILALNILLGWTFLGWVVALVWALKKEPGSPQRS